MKERIIELLKDQMTTSMFSAAVWCDKFMSECDSVKSDSYYGLYRQYKAEADVIADVLEKIERLK